MVFQRKKVSEHSHTYQRRNYKKVSSLQKAHKGTKRTFWSITGKILIGFSVFFFIGLIILYQKIIAPLPSIEELENLKISEASTIYDREGNELYRIFDENRQYVLYENINKNMVNAIVAGEDKRYWENPGVDFIWLLRALLYGVIWKNEGFWGTSTLTQQLIRNTIIENRSSSESIFEKIERKIKEIYLAFKLTNGVSKEKILELYLNKISYGSNAYGIEQAAKTFFAKSAKDVSVLESSMLASLPKWPSYYSPYNNFDRLVWYIYIYEGEETESRIQLITPALLEEHRPSVDMLKRFIKDLKAERYSDSKLLLCGVAKDKVKTNIALDDDGCAVSDYSELLTLLSSIKIQNGEKTIEYEVGRKDFILGRMLEDQYITFDEYKEALLKGLGFEFQSYREDIKAPHFVFYVREYLEKKYGQDLLEKGGLKIYTSLDPKLQEEAERIVAEKAAQNETRFDAQNASLISLNNETWEILAMVGGRDYFDEENKGNVNMATAPLQPGSSFKPFVYALAIDQEVIGSKTPVYDLKTTFPGNYTPKNFDGSFMGKMNISTALNYSRNIPAIKMYFLAGGEEKVLEFMEKMGNTSIREFRDQYSQSSGTKYTYGASMALGTVMISPLDLAHAYSVFANLGYKKELVPVIKVLDAKGLVIEEFVPGTNQEEKPSIDPATAYIINKILSDTSSRPAGWNTFITLSGRPVASKTGTSTKQSSKDASTIYPRNLWTIGYTPQITTVVWAGNTDGSTTNLSWDGLNAAGPIWRDFMNFAHKNLPVLDWKRPTGVKEVSISKISWMLAPEDLDTKFIISSLFVNAPQSYDQSLKTVQVDLLCNGAVSDTTPISAIWTVNLLNLNSLRPNDPAWEGPVQSWVKDGWYKEELWDLGDFLTTLNTNTCERTRLAGNIQIGASISEEDTFVNGSNYIEIAYDSIAPLSKIEVLLGDTLIKSIDIKNEKKWVYIGDINIPTGTQGMQDLVLRAIDNEYYAQGKNYSIMVVKRDSQAPIITLTNPTDSSISLYQWDFFNLRGNVTDRGNVRSINIYIDDSPVKIWIQGRDFTQEISGDDLEPGAYTLRVEAIDMDFNIWKQELSLIILPR